MTNDYRGRNRYLHDAHVHAYYLHLKVKRRVVKRSPFFTAKALRFFEKLNH